jgi:hypothetical protein
LLKKETVDKFLHLTKTSSYLFSLQRNTYIVE